MKLQQLLNHHSKNVPEGSLSNSFGDPYLMMHNSLYRAVRGAALRNGYNYSDEFNADYAALPLSQLEATLKQKKLFYTDNVSVLHKIEARIPQSTVWDEVYDNLKRNFLFHESCHAVSHAVAQKHFKDSSQKIIVALLEESFANTCELLAVIDVHDAVHRDFYEFNSYIFVHEARSVMNELKETLGFKLLFQFMWLAYMHANFLTERLQEKNFQQILSLLSVDAKNVTADQMKKLKNLSRIAFELNPRFVEVTTRFYLRYAGLAASQEDVMKIDFIKAIETDTRFKSYMQDLIKEIGLL